MKLRLHRTFYISRETRITSCTFRVAFPLIADSSVTVSRGITLVAGIIREWVFRSLSSSKKVLSRYEETISTPFLEPEHNKGRLRPFYCRKEWRPRHSPEISVAKFIKWIHWLPKKKRLVPLIILATAIEAFLYFFT